jgi:hypothetical protein
MRIKFIPIFQIGQEEHHSAYLSIPAKILNQRKKTNEFYRLSIEDLKKYKEYIDNESSFVGKILEKKEKELKKIRREIIEKG